MSRHRTADSLSLWHWQTVLAQRSMLLPPKEGFTMYRHNIVQIRAKIRAAQRRAEQEIKRRMHELERKLRQALRK